MKRLYLLRHAKSSWHDPHLRDFDRPLNQRGAREILEMAQYMKEKNYLPEGIICSGAVRTRETLRPILKALDYQGEVEYLDSLYATSPELLMVEIKKHEELDSLLLVGHNPEISGLLSGMLGEFIEMKTSQLAVIDLEDMELIDYIRPKDF